MTSLSSKKKNQTVEEEEQDDEARVLASVAATVQQQDLYEDRVLREAVLGGAPSLVVEQQQTGDNNTTATAPPPLMIQGFPSLQALAPSFDARRHGGSASAANTNTVSPYNPADLPHFYALLTQVRQKLQQQQEESEDDDDPTAKNVLYLQEQMLLHYISSVARVKKTEFTSLVRDQAKREQERSAALCRPQKPVAQQLIPPRRRTRVSIMQRKLIQDEQNQKEQQQQRRGLCNDDDDDVDDEDTAERKQALRQLRLERKRRREARRRQIMMDQSSSESSEEEEAEAVFDDDDDDDERKPAASSSSANNEAGVAVELKDEDDDDTTLARGDETPNAPSGEFKTDAVVVKMEDDGVAVVKMEDDGNDSNAANRSTVVNCPLCQEQLVVEDPSQTDALLSQHMDLCQRRPPRRRAAATARRQRAGAATAAADSDADATTIDTTTTRRTTAAAAKPAAAATTTTTKSRKRKRSSSQKKKTPATTTSTLISHNSKDDLEEWQYLDRVDDWIENGLGRMKDLNQLRDASEELPGSVTLDGGLYIPAWVNDRLFGYQREALAWMWELHQQQAGGLLGDEMGLGKTVQIASYLGSLALSRKLRSVIIVAPATMLQHWLNELAVWAPGLRRVLIHPSGETDGVSRNVSSALLLALAKWLKKSRRDRVNEAIDDEDWETMEDHSFCGTGYAVITTYENLRRNIDIYKSHEWSYMVCDEAQKIRNPDADVTLACKKIRTPHRLAMSGTPIQNDLRELWSLFDFVFPGRLGTLPAFENEFADPVKRGGYSNATPMQVQLAYRCALTLKDLIDPFMLRRQKKEVKETSRMPSKTEQVMFCRLTERQRSMYQAFIQSKSVTSIVRGSSSNQLLAAVTVLRKICNHPDLVCDPDESSFQLFLKHGTSPGAAAARNDDSSSSDIDDDDFGNEESLMERSGKLEVLSKILPLWHKQRHRVLIFCQWKKMLDIVQRFMMLKGWKFGRLDGDTNVSGRQRLVDQFNSDDSYFCLLCTTRTGGVGLNLTGANRIILYDPDWNPSTDAQARERAWRFGQEKEVTIYRLICAGTVEEKIYQRQIFKTALSNKVLQDPRQRRLFSQRDLHDLFTLTADGGSVRSGGDGLTDTGRVTKGVGVVDFDQDVGGGGGAGGDGTDNKDDNDRTLRKVMKSKGLAGVFDHHYVEQDSSRKSTTAREMEDQAKRVASEAARALQQSLNRGRGYDPFAPTWTGSEETAPQPLRRFGGSRPNRAPQGRGGVGPVARPAGLANGSSSSSSSRDILASLRQKNQAADSGGRDRPPSEETQKYAELLARVKNFVKRRTPSTDDILKEFGSSVPNSDVAIFRRLLKSVASMDRGRWYLK